MNIKTASDDEDFVINMVPMVDVVFQLLIFFMVATTLIDPERLLDIELPTAESGAEDRASEEIVLNVLEDGRVVYEGRGLSHEELVAVLRGAAALDVNTPVTIRGHRRAMHQNIVSVMDACGIAGLSNLSVGTSEDRG